MDKIKFSLPAVTEIGEDFIRAETDEEDSELTDSEIPEELNPETDLENHDPNSFAGRLDDKGRPFDPNIHISPAEKTPTGRWRKKPKDRINKKETVSDIRAEAQKLAFLYAGLHVVIFGEDGSIDETGVVSLTNSYERLMAEKGIINTPPVFDVILASIIYTSSIVMRPKNAQKAKGFFAKIWLKIRHYFKKSKPRTKPEPEIAETPKRSIYDNLMGVDR